MTGKNGPLAGLRVVELAGIGPGPYAAMLLADLGADVISVERPGKRPNTVPPALDVLRRNRRSVIIDLRRPEGAGVVRTLVKDADVLIEGNRPGVTERLGLGPDDCWKVNPRLVYGRMTGWGQTGPLAPRAGHDIGYIAVTGALGAVGRAGEAPVPPANLLGDFGGGALFLALGVLAAVWEAGRSGHGQVVDAAIVDGASSLTGLLHGLLASGAWADKRGVNFLDGGVPWYDTYETADREYMAVGALEPKFYAEFLDRLGLDASAVGDRNDPAAWSALRKAIADTFAARTRAEWTRVFDGSDACVAPVLSLTEAPDHPHLRARGTFTDVGGVRQPSPAPRFSRTEAGIPVPPAEPDAHTRDVLAESGIAGIDALVADGTVVQARSEENKK